MSQTLSLYRLQQTDSQIDRAQSRLNAIQKILDDNVELQTAKQAHDAASLHHHSEEQKLKEAEASVQNLRIKLEQTDASLYNGKGHSPKELQDLQDDVLSLKKRLAVLEDSQLDCMQSLEDAEKQVHITQAFLSETEKKFEEQERTFNIEKNSLQKELQKLLAERAANAVSIPVEPLSLYDKLRQERRGIAVAVISDKSCSACGSSLSLAQIQASRSTVHIELCPSCGRILYGN
jgi:predicted  nucleic acid-binding Zn-ribbon protein